MSSKFASKTLLRKTTPFAEAVYRVASKIPKGQTMTYKEVAVAAGRPKAFRAVGNILNKNRDARVFCHRVVRSDGKPGGYAMGGTRMKKKILKREGAL